VKRGRGREVERWGGEEGERWRGGEVKRWRGGVGTHLVENNFVPLHIVSFRQGNCTNLGSIQFKGI